MSPKLEKQRLRDFLLILRFSVALAVFSFSKRPARTVRAIRGRLANKSAKESEKQ